MLIKLHIAVRSGVDNDKAGLGRADNATVGVMVMVLLIIQ